MTRLASGRGMAPAIQAGSGLSGDVAAGSCFQSTRLRTERPEARSIGALAAAVLALGAPALFAADPLEVPTRPSERPLESPGFLPKKAPEGFDLPPVPEAAPEGPATGATVDVARDRLRRQSGHSQRRNCSTVAKPYVGRRLTAADIEELRHTITRHYIGKGYLNSGATVGEDAYRDGTSHLPYRRRPPRSGPAQWHGAAAGILCARPASRGEEPLNVNVLQERFQLLLTDPLFAKMNARLSPGSEPGLAILDVDVTRARPYQLSLFANNYRAPSMGAESYGASGWVRNLTGFGDVLDATYQDGRGGARHSLDWTIPLGPYGTQFQARYEDGRSALVEEALQAIHIESKFKSVEATISHPLIETLRQRFALGLTWSDRESSTTLLGEPFSFTPGEPDGRTKLRVWRFFQDYLQRWEQSVLAARSTFSFGHNNIEQDGVSAPDPAGEFLRLARPVPVRPPRDGQRCPGAAARLRAGNAATIGAAGAGRHRRCGHRARLPREPDRARQRLCRQPGVSLSGVGRERDGSQSDRHCLSRPRGGA